MKDLCASCKYNFNTCNPEIMEFDDLNYKRVIKCNIYSKVNNKPENQCADLNIPEEDFSFQDMLDLQRNLQIDLAARLPLSNIDPTMIATRGELKEWCRDNRDAISDEFKELIEAIGGQDNAIWKKWKANHVVLCNQRVETLSEDEMLELKYEAIDIMHFVNNIFVALRMDAAEIGKMYAAKNAENLRRYKSQY